MKYTKTDISWNFILRALKYRLWKDFIVTDEVYKRNARVLGLNYIVKDYSAIGEIWNTLPTILELEIDIAHDRFLNDKYGGIKHTASVKQKVLPKKIIQKEISGNSQVKI